MALDLVEAPDARDIDERRRRRQAEVEERQQALAACEHLGVGDCPRRDTASLTLEAAT